MEEPNSDLKLLTNGDAVNKPQSTAENLSLVNTVAKVWICYVLYIVLKLLAEFYRADSDEQK